MVEWWDRTWRSPVAAAWDRTVDFQAIARLGDLYAQLAAGPAGGALHAQAARLETDLLLTPKARRAAYVELVGDDPDFMAVAPKRQRPRLIVTEESTDGR